MSTCRSTLVASLALALALLAGVGPAAAQDGPRFSLSTSFNYSTGDYGTGKDTELIYVPLTFGVTLDRFAAGLTLPYIHQTSQTVTVTGGGVAVRKDRQGRLTTAPSTVTESEGGLGDILLRLSYVVVKDEGAFPEIAPYLKIKFPTADESRGLGTGEFDETLGVDLSKTFLEKLTAYLTLAYTFVGSPPGASFDNSFGWSLGAAYAVTAPLTVFAFLDGATAISPGQDDPLELRLGAEYRLTKVVKLTGAVTRGFTDGSPDWGVSAGVGLRF